MTDEYVVGNLDVYEPLGDATHATIYAVVRPEALLSSGINRAIEAAKKEQSMPDALAGILNAAAADGWRVVAAQTYARSRNHGWNFVLCREKPLT